MNTEQTMKHHQVHLNILQHPRYFLDYSFLSSYEKYRSFLNTDKPTGFEDEEAGNENTSEDIAEEFAIPIGYTSRSTYIDTRYLLRVVKKLTSVLFAGFKKVNKNYPNEPTL